MHTWALICQLTLTPAQCNLETADRWFVVAPGGRVDIRRTLNRKGLLNTSSQYIITFKYAGSLGTDSYIYYPCDTPKAELVENARQIGGDAGSWALKELAKGDCLR